MMSRRELALGTLDADNLREPCDPSILPSDVHADEIARHLCHAASDRQSEISDRLLRDMARNIVLECHDDLTIFVLLLHHPLLVRSFWDRYSKIKCGVQRRDGI